MFFIVSRLQSIISKQVQNLNFENVSNTHESESNAGGALKFDALGDQTFAQVCNFYITGKKKHIPLALVHKGVLFVFFCISHYMTSS